MTNLPLYIAIPFLLAWPAYYLYTRWNRWRRLGRDGAPKTGSEWKNRTTKDKFVIEPSTVTTRDGKTTPVRTPTGKPATVVRKGFISVVWPKDTFDQHFK